MTARSELQQSRRIVIKVGSKALAADGELQKNFAQQLAALAKPKRAGQALNEETAGVLGGRTAAAD